MKIPFFKSEEEEIEFWDTHSSVDYFDDTEEVKEKIEISNELQKKILKRKQKKKLLTIRLDQELIDKTKKIAKSKAIGYQTLMRMWIAEGLNRANIK
ncbi:MAG TPA: CopG family antitoxin [Candidatus Eremiobacteraeota bacterium]|nr:MAG: hypothetical protein BWY64_01959 [bacterium ADurb.Bin363]HPZ07365.1 CopG family antitoxin [Candidatus Eremiobacteraeota bacterium]